MLIPYRRIALNGFVLNTLWEFGQCMVLYDMWGWPFWKATVWMWGAILGDVLIVLGVVYLARLLVGAPRFWPPTRTGWAALLGIGFVSSVGLEWLAIVMHLWDYGTLMPTLDVLGTPVGLSPIVQVTLLPAVSVFLARPSKNSP